MCVEAITAAARATPTPAPPRKGEGGKRVISHGRWYDYSQASLLAPLAYTEMIVAVAAGWWFFGDFPDGWTFVGVGVLIASAIYISFRERAHNIPPPSDFEQP